MKIKISMSILLSLATAALLVHDTAAALAPAPVSPLEPINDNDDDNNLPDNTSPDLYVQN